MSTTPLATTTTLAPLPRNFWLTGFFASITWRSFSYHLIAIFMAVLGFTYVMVAITLGLSLAVTIIGLVVFAVVNIGARHFGGCFRGLSNSLLGSHIPAPLPRRATKGIGAFTKSGVLDPQGWRFMVFGLLYFVNAIVAVTISLTFFALGLGGLTYRLWYQFLPFQQARDGSWHQGATLWFDYFIDTPERIGLTALISALVLFFGWPIVTVKLGALQALTTASLLGPSPESLKVHELRVQQAATVDRSAAELRNIERDLHDITQAQLVAIAMKLSDAKDRLASGTAASDIAGILDQAHSTSKAALTDLRSLVQGIHPAVLNSGLATALQTLASSAAVPTKLQTNLTAPISPSIEAVAYYCAAELLNNAAKHSGSPTVLLRAHTINANDTAPSTPAHDRLILQVCDDGVGGAALNSGQGAPSGSTGTGLVGLLQRISAVAGTLDVHSPAGGPTVVTVELPTTLEVV